MNTLFWGPSAWELIHSIGLVYPKNPTEIERQIFFDFFDAIQYVLPCKHCRKSYSVFYKDIELKGGKLYDWTWKLHNKVNNKLRGQGLKNNENPTLSESKINSKKKLKESRKNNKFPGLDFINCVFMDCKSNTKKNNFIQSFKKIGGYLKIPMVELYCKMDCNLSKSTNDALESQFKNINVCKDLCSLKGLPTTKKYNIKEYLDFYKKFVANCGAQTCR
jgi:hypothetical protein